MNHTEHPLAMAATAEQSSVVGATSKESLKVGWIVGILAECGFIVVSSHAERFETEAEAKASAERRHRDRPFMRFVAVSATPPAAEGEHE